MSRMREALLAARALIDDALKAGEEELRPKQLPRRPPHVGIAEYAELRGVSVSTVRRWLGQQMPHLRPGGRIIRINIEVADAWVDDGCTTERKQAVPILEIVDDKRNSRGS